MRLLQCRIRPGAVPQSEHGHETGAAMRSSWGSTPRSTRSTARLSEASQQGVSFTYTVAGVLGVRYSGTDVGHARKALDRPDLGSPPELRTVTIRVVKGRYSITCNNFRLVHVSFHGILLPECPYGTCAECGSPDRRLYPSGATGDECRRRETVLRGQCCGPCWDAYEHAHKTCESCDGCGSIDGEAA